MLLTQQIGSEGLLLLTAQSLLGVGNIMLAKIDMILALTYLESRGQLSI